MLLVACVAVVALVAAATALGLLQRRRAGRVRASRPDAVEASLFDPAAVLGERVTFVQFSTAFCAACRPTARLLRELESAVPGAARIEVRVDERPRLAERFAVLQAPTTLLLDHAGTVRARVVGVPRRDELERAIADLLEEPRAVR